MKLNSIESWLLFYSLRRLLFQVKMHVYSLIASGGGAASALEVHRSKLTKLPLLPIDS